MFLGRGSARRNRYSSAGSPDTVRGNNCPHSCSEVSSVLSEAIALARASSASSSRVQVIRSSSLWNLSASPKLSVS